MDNASSDQTNESISQVEAGINEDFRLKVENFRALLAGLKEDFLAFDNNHPNRGERINFVKSKKDEVFFLFNKFFREVWPHAQSLEKKSFKSYQQYYQKILSDPLLEAEINRYIKEKPLGYPGDYVMMNYIYDGHNDFVGESSLMMLINHYTTNIPISCSNIKRKDYFKQKISELLDSAKQSAKIASVGCGSARELIELAEEGKINKPLVFTCVDFESHALNYIESQLLKIEADKKRFLEMRYYQFDIREVVRKQDMLAIVGEQDVVYASGLFDYLGDYLAKKILSVLFSLVRSSGLLIIVNAGLRDVEFRSYYEMLGEWRFFHRSEEDILTWTKALKNVASVEFEEFSFPMNYLFLLIKKT